MSTGLKLSLFFGFLGIGAFFFLGNFHIVTDFGIIERPYFGFSDVVGGTVQCSLQAQFMGEPAHLSLCLALQNAGYKEKVESMDDRTKRMQKESQGYGL